MDRLATKFVNAGLKMPSNNKNEHIQIYFTFVRILAPVVEKINRTDKKVLAEKTSHHSVFAHISDQ